MNGKPSSVVKPVVIAAAISLVVTALRLYGERADWDPRYFSKETGGKGSLVGISWLMFIFGAWFGAHLARAGQGPARPGKVLGLHAIAAAVLMGTFFANVAMAGKTADGKPNLGTLEALQKFMYINAAGGGVAALIALYAWPRLGLTNLLYAILARVPVVMVTYFACKNDWDTHYTKLGPTNLGGLDWETKAFWLGFVQVTVWPEMTIVFGGLCGALAALIFRRKQPT